MASILAQGGPQVANADDLIGASSTEGNEAPPRVPPSERDALKEKHKGMIGDGRYLLYTIYYSKCSRLLLTTG